MLEDLVDVLGIVSLVGNQHALSSELELGDLADLVDDKLWVRGLYCS